MRQFRHGWTARKKPKLNMGDIFRIENNSICVSSLVISYNETHIFIDSKTKKTFEGRKMNKLLRSVIILLSKTIFPNAQSVVSDATNPISTQIMIKHFHAIPCGDDKYETFDTYEDIKTYMDRDEKSGITTKVILNDENIENANSVFREIIDKEFKCVKKGGTNRKSRRTRKSNKSRKGKSKRNGFSRTRSKTTKNKKRVTRRR
jgi:hypothetical protein